MIVWAGIVMKRTDSVVDIDSSFQKYTKLDDQTQKTTTGNITVMKEIYTSFINGHRAGFALARFSKKFMISCQYQALQIM